MKRHNEKAYMMVIHACKHPVMYFGVLIVELAALCFGVSSLYSLLRQFSFEAYVFFQLLVEFA